MSLSFVFPLELTSEEKAVIEPTRLSISFFAIYHDAHYNTVTVLLYQGYENEIIMYMLVV
jgi:hypothetical protein